MADIEARLRAVEEAVARLQQPDDSGAATDPQERLWFLREMQRLYPDGAVAFAGHLQTPDGLAEWQWGRTTDDLLTDDWGAVAPSLAALGHPVRLHLLRLWPTGTPPPPARAETDGLGTTGQLHHHLRALVAAGWLASAGRGRYTVPAARVVPLLVLISATI
ncbi:MAG: ArsR family transcriptional regulator [Mobilicoccus sp.]|nr:ArsR family transcriptional regulator [Mobilicoccus sp.]